jgi:hypothetical protein
MKNLSGELTSVPNKSGQSGLSYETKNKEAIQRLKDKKNKPLDPDDVLPDYNETPGEYSRRNTPGSIENLREEMKIAYRNEFDRLTGNETAEELKEILKNLDTDGVPFAEGGSTSTGLNYLLGEDDTNSRVPYATGGRRGFLKILAGLGAAGAAFKTGLLSLKGAAKPVAKEVAKEVVTSGAPPPHFFKLVAKIKALGDDVTEKAATQDRQVVKQYKDFEMTEDVSTGEIQIFKRSQSDEALDRFASENANEEVFMRYKPGKGQADETTKGKKIPDEYEENTSYISNNRENTGEILEEVSGVPDDIFEEVGEAVPEAIRKGKADGGRMGYAGGKKVVEGLISLLNKKAGKDVLTTADKIAIPKKTLDRDMFKNFDDRNPEMQTLRDGKTKSIIPKNEYAEYSKEFDQNRLLTDAEIEDYEMELGDTESWMMDGTVGEAEKALIEKKEYMADIMRMKERGDFGDFSPSKLDNVNDAQIEAAVEDVIPTGDNKLDAEMAAESLVENNPQIFGDDMLYDDLDDLTRSKIYGAVYDRLSNNMAKMIKEKRNLSSPTKTLESMKSGKGIDMSDPDIVEEFTRFMKEKNPKGYKDMEQKIQLESFDPKKTKGNAEGGRIGLLSGGGVLKKLIMNLAKEKGMSGSEVLKVMNYKSLPSKIKNLMTKEEFTSMKDQRLEGVEIWRDLMSSQQEMTRNIDAGKNTPAAELFEMLEKTSPGYGTVPRNISDADMLQMEQMIKNMKTKDNRQLNAKGGLANLLGE